MTVTFFPGAVFFSDAAPQAVRHHGRDIFLNYSLSIPEALFVISMNKLIFPHLEQGKKLIYIGTNPQMQSGFEKWVDSFWEAKQLSVEKKIAQEQLDIGALIPSIWEKTKNFVNNVLFFSVNEKEMTEETVQQQQADEALADLRQQGRMGQVFTKRQAHHLCIAASKYLEELPRLIDEAGLSDSANELAV